MGIGEAVGGTANDAVLRVGRQELHCGDGRLLAARVGPNVRADFDGVVLRGRVGRITTDALAVRGVTDSPRSVDNAPDDAEHLWGVYSSVAGRRVNVHLLHLAQARAVSLYAFTPDRFAETRHTLGFRACRGRGACDETRA